MIARKLAYLLALAKERHYGRAAAACRVSQPALSAGIHQLEIELGFPIVKRFGQRFTGFTHAGEVVLKWAQKSADDCARLQQELRDLPGASSGMLRIGTLNSASALVSNFTVPFEEKFPDVSLTILSQNAVELQQALDDFVIDVALTYIDPNPKKYLYAQSLYTEEYELLARKDSRFSGKECVSWDEIRGLPLCTLSPEMRVLDEEESGNVVEDQRQVRHIVTNSVWVVIGHVRTGKWFSVLPRAVHAMIADAMAAGDDEIEAIPVARNSPAPEVGIVVPFRDPPSALVEAFFKIATKPDVLQAFQQSMK
jgi:DNA-binding transcriptional LysR family regulator